MRENQLPDDDSSNSVQITLAHFSAAGSASAATPVSIASPALPSPLNQHVAYNLEGSTELDDAEGFTELDDPEGSTELDDPDGFTELDDPDGFTELEARASKSETWLLAAAVISATTLFTALYTIRNPEWVPSFVGQTVKISKQLSADIKRRAITALGGTAVTDTVTAGAGTVAGAADIHGASTGHNSASAVHPKGETAINGLTRNSVVGGVRPASPASSSDVDRSAAPHDDTSSGVHRTLASGRDETGTRENSRRHTNNNFFVPPPPPTPYVLPPASGLFPGQPVQQDAALEQELQQAHAQASPKAHNQVAAREDTSQQATAASGRTEAPQSTAVVEADKELQAALKSSLHTVGEWTR